ncbi:MAG: regulatory protein RecX [Mycobacteriales bacterium]
MRPADRAEPEDQLADPPADPESVARTICLRLLTSRPRSRSELAHALRRRNVPGEVAETILDRLTAVKLIDDEAFAADWVSARHSGKGLAGRALAAELRSRGIAAETATEAVAGLDSDTERATARRLVDRRLSNQPAGGGAGQVRRLVAMLGRKGYPPGLASTVVREAIAESAMESELTDGEVAGDEACCVDS